MLAVSATATAATQSCAVNACPTATPTVRSISTTSQYCDSRAVTSAIAVASSANSGARNHTRTVAKRWNIAASRRRRAGGSWATRRVRTHSEWPTTSARCHAGTSTTSLKRVSVSTASLSAAARIGTSSISACSNAGSVADGSARAWRTCFTPTATSAMAARCMLRPTHAKSTSPNRAAAVSSTTQLSTVPSSVTTAATTMDDGIRSAVAARTAVRPNDSEPSPLILRAEGGGPAHRSTANVARKTTTTRDRRSKLFATMAPRK